MMTTVNATRITRLIKILLQWRFDYLRSNRVLSTRLQVQRCKHRRAFLSFGLRPKSKPPASRAVVTPGKQPAVLSEAAAAFDLACILN
jgi:hypothetical protein